MSEFQVQRKQFVNSRILETPPLDEAELEAGEVLVKVDRFAYTANNITYAVAGDQIGYWQFFPPLQSSNDEWGIIPVWGFGDVVLSSNSEIPVGDRLFGYFPPATHLKLAPKNISVSKFVDNSAHRSHLPAGYNLYRRVLGEPNYNKQFDNQRMLLYPLHLTAFCLWDALQYNDWYGAEQVIILSASSKTSIGLALGLDEDKNAPQTIGITSERNKQKVLALNLYKEVFTYEEAAHLDVNKQSVIVDMSGNMQVVNVLNQSLAENLAYCIQVGLTHWEQAGQRIAVEKGKREFFFAPGHLQMRIKEWGFEKFDADSSKFILNSAKRMNQWLTYEMIDGLEGLAEIHEKVCLGKIAADKALIVEMP